MADQGVVDTTVERLLRRVVEGQETVFDIGAVGDDGIAKVSFGYRKLQPEIVAPQRSESPPRQHVLHTAEAVVAYVNEYGSDKTVILLDATTLSGRIVLYEDGDRGFEVLEFHPTLHPIFTEWQTVIGKTVEVLRFAEFVLAHRRQVIEPDGKTLALIFSQVRADKATTIHRGTGKEAVNGIVVAVKIGSQVKETPIDIPDLVKIGVPLFIGMPSQVIELDLLVTERDDKIMILASAAGVLEAQHQAFDAMASEIRGGLDHEKATVAAGCVKHGTWSYLKA